MEKERKNNNTGVIVLLSILLIAVLAFGIWAFSRYTTTINGKGKADVAKWNFQASGQAVTVDGVDLAAASADNGVIFDYKNNVVTDKIAPGTRGSFTVALNTEGTEVALDYVIKLAGMSSKPTNLHFYKTADDARAAESGTSTALEKAVDLEEDAPAGTATYSGTIAQGDNKSKAAEVTIYWVWAYQTGDNDDEKAANDVIDTTEGKAAADHGVNFTMTVTGTQVDPNSTQVTTHQN